MENDFIQITASAGHAVAYTIGKSFKQIIDCVQLYFTNGFRNIILYSVTCLWLVGVILIFDGTPQIVVQRCQIAAQIAMGLIMRSSKTGRKTSSVVSAL